MNINKFSKTGAFHRALNQDYLFNIEGKDYITIMFANGATACEMGLGRGEIIMSGNGAGY